MANEELILKLYERTANEVLKNVTEEYKNELLLGYMDSLKRNYSNFDFSGRDIEKLLATFAELEMSKWRGVSQDSKLSELLKDEAMDNIKYVSNVGYKYASERRGKKSLNGTEYLIPTIGEEQADENIRVLESNFGKVRSFNKQLAEYYVSESTMDFEYACGRAENMSLRVGRLL